MITSLVLTFGAWAGLICFLLWLRLSRGKFRPDTGIKCLKFKDRELRAEELDLLYLGRSAIGALLVAFVLVLQLEVPSQDQPWFYWLIRLQSLICSIGIFALWLRLSMRFVVEQRSESSRDEGELVFLWKIPCAILFSLHQEILKELQRREQLKREEEAQVTSSANKHWDNNPYEI